MTAPARPSRSTSGPASARASRPCSDVLGGLSRADWERPTVCPGWNVMDVVAHVLGDDLGRLARTRDGCLGTAPSAPGESLLAFVDRINDEWVVAARRLSPRRLVDLLAFDRSQIASDVGRHRHRRARRARVLGRPGCGAGLARRRPRPVRVLDASPADRLGHRQADARAGPRRAPPSSWWRPSLDTFLRALPSTLRDVRRTPGTAPSSRLRWSPDRCGGSLERRSGARRPVVSRLDQPASTVRATPSHLRLAHGAHDVDACQPAAGAFHLPDAMLRTGPSHRRRPVAWPTPRWSFAPPSCDRLARPWEAAERALSGPPTEAGPGRGHHGGCARAPRRG